MSSTHVVAAPVPIAVHGASGRMGRAVVRLAAADPGLRVVAALVRAGSASEGESLALAPGVVHSATLAPTANPAVLVDASDARAFDAALALACLHRMAFVSGTTGLDARQQRLLDDAAAVIPVLWAANFSLGVAVLRQLVAQAAAALPAWDCEIAEVHHAGKRDAPSGTALELGRVVAATREGAFAQLAVMGRAGEGERAPGSIGLASLRAGDIVGEHTVMFAGAGERIELVHRATDRDIFARGALAAARWLVGREPGRHALEDMIFSR